MQEIKNKKFKVIRIIWYSQQTKWGVLATKPLGSLDGYEADLMNDFSNICISGNFEGIFEGAEIVVSGDVVTNSKYGKQIQIRSIKVKQDTKSREGVVNFLAKSFIKGISVANANKIYDKFQDRAIKIVLNNPKDLLNVFGIGEKTVEKITESVKQYKSKEDLIDYCTKIGLTYSIIVKLDEALGEKALSIIQVDPYKVLELTDTISFPAIDEVYLNNGGNARSKRRLSVGLLWVLKKASTMEGSTGCYSVSLKKKFFKLLGFEEKEENIYWDTLTRLKYSGDIVISEVKGKLNSYEVVFYKKYLDMEERIAGALHILEHEGISSKELNKNIIKQEIKDFPFTLNKQQVDAVNECSKHNVSVITGCAGCVDGDTEFFNGKEWKPIKDFKVGDKVLQFNKDRMAELVTPIRYIKGEADLWHMYNANGSIDQVLSDDHRFVYETSKGNLNFKPFEEIRRIMEAKKSFSAGILSTFTYKGAKVFDINKDRLRLMIAISADGSLCKNGCYWRVRLKKERKIQRLKQLLKNVGLEIQEQIFTDGYSNFKIPVEYGCKEFPTEFYFLTGKLREVFCEEIVLWDGSVISGKRNVNNYSTSIKKNADIAQFLMSQDGYRTSILIDDRVGKIHKGNSYEYKSLNYRVSKTKHRLTTLNRDHRKLSRQNDNSIRIEKFISKDGLQYCFEVPSGMLVLRRNNKIFITGNSGKSSITKAIYNIYKRSEYNVELLAPTAKAVRRLEECTGGFAQTLHKFVGMTKNGKVIDTEFRYAENTVIIIDEASMMDIILFDLILKRISPDTKIILIGDNNQLPSVQAGNILGDVIESDDVYVATLTDVVRQQENSNIIKFCKYINDGKIFEPCELSDFHYEEFGTAEELRDVLFSAYEKEVNKYGLNEVQVIAPYKQGELGMSNLNLMLQAKYQEKIKGPVAIEPFRLGDKVRHIQNNYKRDVYNGETGVVVSVVDEVMLVDFGYKQVAYEGSDLCELTLSFASTVHASQGSEYKVVFIILDDTAANNLLHIRRLLYTAVSRGKEKVYILSKPYLVDKCIENNSYKPRVTKLKEFLEELKEGKK